MKSKSSVKKLSVIILFFELLVMCGGYIGMSYIEYAYTDLAHVDLATMTIGMTVASIVNFAVALFAGVIIQKAKPGKMGKFRKFLLIGYLVSAVGSMMMVFTFAESMIAKAVIISVGYFLFNASLDFTYNAKYSLYGRMAAGDSDTLGAFNGMAYAGANAGYIVLGLVFLPLVGLLGRGNEQMGYFLVQAFLCAFVIIGVIIFLRASKPYEGGNTIEEEEAAELGIIEMLKGAFANRAALTVFCGFMFKGLGYTLFNFLLVYQCFSVFGSEVSMMIAMTGMSIVCMLGGLLAPKVSQWLGGRKRTVMITYTVAAIAFVVNGFVGTNMIAFLIIMFIGLLIQSIGDTFEPTLYLDAGEYWYHKTGNDTRAFVMSLPGIGAKIYYIFVPALTAWVLSSANYSDEIGWLEGQDAATFTRGFNWIPAATLVIFLLIIKLFHNVSDKEIEVCITENAKKDAAQGAE